MKKILALLVILSISLSLCACSELLRPFESLGIKLPLTPESEENTPTTAATAATAKNPSNPTDASQLDLSCRGITLDADMVILDKAGNAHLLSYKLQPENTTDKVTFTSENPEIATVNEKGSVTAVAEGETRIIIKCGQVERICTVYCQFEKETTAPGSADPAATVDSNDSTSETTSSAPVQGTIRLNRKDISFTYKGESWALYSGDIPKNLITYSSDDEKVATFADGKVVAEGGGMTTIYASYGDQKVSCIVRCAFKESTGVVGNGGVSENGGGITEDGDSIGNIGTPVNLTGKIVNVQDSVNVRDDVNGNKIGVLLKDDAVTITEIKYDTSGKMWACTQAGWVPMDYVSLNSY